MLKQLQFNWDAADKYTEWKAFVLEVRNVISTYNAHARKNHNGKELVGQKGPTLY